MQTIWYCFIQTVPDALNFILHSGNWLNFKLGHKLTMISSQLLPYIIRCEVDKLSWVITSYIFVSRLVYKKFENIDMDLWPFIIIMAFYYGLVNTVYLKCFSKVQNYLHSWKKGHNYCLNFKAIPKVPRRYQKSYNATPSEQFQNQIEKCHRNNGKIDTPNTFISVISS